MPFAFVFKSYVCPTGRTQCGAGTKLEHLSDGVDLCGQAFIALCVAAATAATVYYYLGGAREKLWRRRSWCCFRFRFCLFVFFVLLAVLHYIM